MQLLSGSRSLTVTALSEVVATIMAVVGRVCFSNGAAQPEDGLSSTIDGSRKPETGHIADSALICYHWSGEVAALPASVTNAPILRLICESFALRDHRTGRRLLCLSA